MKKRYFTIYLGLLLKKKVKFCYTGNMCSVIIIGSLKLGFDPYSQRFIFISFVLNRFVSLKKNCRIAWRSRQNKVKIKGKMNKKNCFNRKLV